MKYEVSNMDRRPENLENMCSAPAIVHTCGIIERRRYHSTPGTKSSHTMMTVVLAGAGTYRRAAASIRVERGMVGLVSPDDRGILMADPNDPYVHLYCRFSGSFATALARRIVAERRRRFFRAERFLEVAQRLRQIGPVVGDAERRSFDRRDLLLLDSLLVLAHTERRSAVPMVTGEAIRTYVVEHLDEPTDLQTMASHFGVSKSTLCRRAREDIGLSVLAIGEQEKIAWASTLLRDTALSVGEAAARVGYADPYYFSRVFKKHTGSSPRTFRAAHRR